MDSKTVKPDSYMGVTIPKALRQLRKALKKVKKMDNDKAIAAAKIATALSAEAIIKSATNVRHFVDVMVAEEKN